MNWQQLEDAYFRTAKRLINGVVRENSDQTIYAIALHEYYSELDGAITLPFVGVNSLESLSKKDGSTKYNPADWQWHDLEVTTRELERLTDQLHAEANRSTQDHWYRTEKRFINTLIRIVKRLYKEFKDHPRTTADFVCYPTFDCEGMDVLAKSVPKKLLMQHFGSHYKAEAKRAKVVSSSAADKLEKFREDLWEFEDEVAAMGAGALDFLLAELKTGADKNTAARLFGRIGIADQNVIKALRRDVTTSAKNAAWCARALGMLGDTDWLLTQSEPEETREIAITGITGPLMAWASDCNTPVPLDYRPLEALLEKGSDYELIAAKIVKPGSSFIEITRDDVDEAIRGMQSPHVLIRQHAVCVAGERKLGKAAGKKLLPAVVGCFQDDVANVRRLAILSLSDWKAAAKPWHDDARKLYNDPNSNVRMYAYDKFSNMG